MSVKLHLLFTSQPTIPLNVQVAAARGGRGGRPALAIVAATGFNTAKVGEARRGQILKRSGACVWEGQGGGQEEHWGRGRGAKEGRVWEREVSRVYSLHPLHFLVQSTGVVWDGARPGHRGLRVGAGLNVGQVGHGLGLCACTRLQAAQPLCGSDDHQT